MLKIGTIGTGNIVSEFIDIIYIASPNGLHYQQAKYFLQQQNHVLVEKPATFFCTWINWIKTNSRN
ncbi:MAG: hypothetical protein SPLM_06760 [Spiroplasma phoeniceum]|uniref:Gfo/Idh/MocA family oxidoreductase n=1 Tax=Spiroplasma phoeniceum TaxID=47835 RepID=UPI003276DE10